MNRDGNVNFGRPSVEFTSIGDYDEAFYMRVYGAGQYRCQGADLGILATHGRMQTDDRQLTDRGQLWNAGIKAQFASIAPAAAYFWVVVMGFEAVAGAAILQKWLPGVPLWSMALGLLMLMTATNLYSVRSHGEFEYWFALIKAAAICIFLALGRCFVLGLWPGHAMDFSNLTSRGGFLPTGPWAMFSGIVVVVFSMVGAEVATIAAAESDDPEHAVVKTTNSVVMRICIFFVGSIFMLVIILPWNGAWLDFSPMLRPSRQWV
jgi:L-asparagine transporter-like permease